MKKKIYITIISILSILLQMTVLEYARIDNIKPDFMLVLIIVLSLMGDKESDVFFGGIICGILQDVLASKVLGVYLIINILFCTIITKIRDKLYRENLVTYILIIFVAALVYDGLSYLICAFPNTLKEIPFVLKNFILKGAIYNTICASIIFAIAQKTNYIGEDYDR